MMMNSIEDYQNLVELLKLALEFYAKANNDEFNIDKGFQAKFALSKIRELEGEYEKMVKEYNNSLDINDLGEVFDKLENDLDEIKLKYGNNKV